MANSINHSDVYSISYGIPESHIKHTSQPYIVNTELLKLCAMGITVVAASGDDGVHGFFLSCAYDPVFPASSPYVTSVGATMGVESGTPEVTCQGDKGGIITSGGGFSTIFPAFPQQKSAINQYFETVSPKPALGYSSSGRGYPDVSLAGVNYAVIIGGDVYSLSGTGASTPSVAGMITLINAARRAAGRPTVGWLNPALYASNGSFANDITIGNNLCTSDSYIYGVPRCCIEGFNTTPGWDPVTGFGSVDFNELYSLLVNKVNKLGKSSRPTASPIYKRPTQTGIRFGATLHLVYLIICYILSDSRRSRVYKRQ